MSGAKDELLLDEVRVKLTVAEVKALRHLLAAAHNAIPGGVAWCTKPLIEALDQKLKNVLP